jgi:hypothetical protein
MTFPTARIISNTSASSLLQRAELIALVMRETLLCTEEIEESETSLHLYQEHSTCSNHSCDPEIVG